MAQDNFQTTFQVLVQGLGQAQKYAQALTAIANAQARAVSTAQGVNATMPKITSGLTYLDQAGNKVTRTVATVNGKLVEMSTHVDSTGKKTQTAAQQVDSLTKSWGLLARVMVGSLIARGIGTLISGLREGMQTAMEFNLRVGEIQTISQNVSVSTDQWTTSIRRLSDAYGQSLLDTVEGVYQTISNQTAHGVEATYFMTEAQKFAVIAVTDTANSVELLSGALNAYGESADKADEYSAVLFKTIELGRLRAEEIANSMGRVNSVAAQLGVPFEEVGATLATMTRQGVKVNEAMTYLRNIFQKLIRPSDHMKEIFKEWGVASGAAAIKTYGFVDVMQKLNKIADESGDPVTELGDQWQRIRSIVGALSLKNSKDWLADVHAISNASDDAAEALKRMMDTPAFQLNKELNEIKNIFTVDLGNELIKTFAAINATGLDFSETLKEILTAGLRLGTFTVVIVGLTAAFTRLRAASTAVFASNPALWAVLAASAAYEVTTAFWEMQEGITASSEESWAAATQYFEGIRTAAINMSTTVGEAVTAVIAKNAQEFDQASAALRALFNEYESMADIQRKITDAIYESAQKSASPVQKLINAQNEFEKKKAYGLELIKEGELEEALKVAKAMQSIADNMQKTGRVPYSPNLNLNLPPGSYEFRNGIPAAAVHQQTQRQADQFLQQLRAKATEEGDFTSLTPGQLKGKMDEYDAARQKLDSFTEQVKTNTEKLAEYRKNAVAYATQIKEAFDRMVTSPGGTGILDENKLGPTAGNGWTFPTGFKDEVKKFSDAQRQLSELFANQQKSGQAFTAEQAEQVKVAVLQLVTSNSTLQAMGANLSALKGWPQELSGMLKGMAEAATYFVEQSKAAETGEQKLADLAKALPNAATAVDNIYTGILKAKGGWAGFGSTGAEAIGTVSRMMDELTRKLNAFIESANNASRNIPVAAPNTRTPGTVTGGLIKRFATGGHVGGDTVAAMLSPGEFVTNRAASRKFLPLLSAINSGSTRMASGGAVTNNVGDVNVTVQGGNTSEATVRQIGNALRRELKRGNIRLS